MSKNDQKTNKLNKYEIDANIEEIHNSEDNSIFKYEFTALSDPKNVRLAIEGTANISGDTLERNEILNKDENDVPKILTLIYQELFPMFFLLSKSLNVSCPPHIIGSVVPVDDADKITETKSEIESEPEPITPTV